MLFCPYCANNLTIGDAESTNDNAWVCPTCPYKWVIKQQISMRTHFKRKEVDDVLGGKEAWANVDKVADVASEEQLGAESWFALTAATCPKCDHRMAYFRQLQIRSADEPMTTFYKCLECAHQWREN